MSDRKPSDVLDNMDNEQARRHPAQWSSLSSREKALILSGLTEILITYRSHPAFRQDALEVEALRASLRCSKPQEPSK